MIILLISFISSVISVNPLRLDIFPILVSIDLKSASNVLNFVFKASIDVVLLVAVLNTVDTLVLVSVKLDLRSSILSNAFVVFSEAVVAAVIALLAASIAVFAVVLILSIRVSYVLTLSAASDAIVNAELLF